MRNKILTLTGLVLISACEVTVKDGTTPVPTTRALDPVPEVEVIEDPLPTTDPLEAFLYPSLNLTSNIEAQHRDRFRDLNEFDMRILDMPTYNSFPFGEVYRYPVYLESSYGIEYQYIQQNRTTGLIQLCASNTFSKCYAEIRNVRWIDGSTAALDLCYVYNNVDWNTCTTKYSNE